MLVTSEHPFYVSGVYRHSCRVWRAALQPQKPALYLSLNLPFLYVLSSWMLDQISNYISKRDFFFFKYFLKIQQIIIVAMDKINFKKL